MLALRWLHWPPAGRDHGLPCRRSATRFERSLKILMDEGEGLTRDISVSGVYFHTDRWLEPGASLRFVVVLTPDQSAQPFLWCEGLVVRVEPGEARRLGVGVALRYVRHDRGRLGAHHGLDDTRPG